MKILDGLSLEKVEKKYKIAQQETVNCYLSTIKDWLKRNQNYITFPIF